jgi:hypothetical protein
MLRKQAAISSRSVAGRRIRRMRLYNGSADVSSVTQMPALFMWSITAAKENDLLIPLGWLILFRRMVVCEVNS